MICREACAALHLTQLPRCQLNLTVRVIQHYTKNEVFHIKDFFSKVTFTEEILNGKLHFFAVQYSTQSIFEYNCNTSLF